MNAANASTRRDFLKASGLGAAALASSTLLSACGPSTQTANTGSSSPSAASGFGDNGTMRVGMEVAYPPYNWQTSESTDDTIPVQGQDGAYADGYDIVFAKKIGTALGLEPVAVKMEFSGLVEGLTNGVIDVICGGMTATDERRQSIDFSDPYWVGHYGLLVKKGSSYEGATSLSVFSGAAVLGQRDTLLDTVIDEIDGVNHMTPVDSVPAQLSALNQGTCDAITFDVENEKGLLAANPDLVAVQIDGSKILFQEDVPINVGIAKGHDDVLAKINDAIKSVSQDERQAAWDAVQERLPQ
ncbi:transporter substrate-binding domain-containing protein [Olsenella massiliensis]|uniref:transporter substrate-binding domain-containing protein n=1 Tax=Olsenella massiliensis TaxID=1622075 RepID=UPI00071E1175|nr:transporter substrate-binding domain-containing protein [Olsenella massiliensis]